MSEQPWLALVGIGEDGRDGLSAKASTALDRARLVVGGARHLALAAPLSCRTMTWPSPIDDALPKIVALRGTPVAILATGDPFHYGIGTMLSRHVAASEIVSFPQPSAFSLAASRLCWSLQEAALVSLHGREETALLRHLVPGRKILILSWDGDTPSRVAAILRERGFGLSQMTVLEAMGGPRERRQEATADAFNLCGIDPLNTIAVECVSSRIAERQTCGCLPDDAFEHDGQITKQSVRAATLTALAPRGGELLWDVGAGCGSVAIEWLRIAPGNSAIAIEAKPERAARIARNAERHGVAPKIVTGVAPEAFAALAQPDAIFIGGGASDAAVVDGAMQALAPGGRLVANAVTLQAQAHLTHCCEAHGGRLASLQHAQAVPVGRFLGWRPAMPIVQWRWCKPR